jgi:23S rRNA U2552 (ribose-2'-O)-methylase RlmE/FtsJ
VDSFDAYSKTFLCTTDGSSQTIVCPLGDETHTCDYATYGGGRAYIVNYVCPKVVPLCLWFDNSAGAFSSEGCVVATGYTSSAVTCECKILPATFVLSANTTGAELTAFATPAPMFEPTQQPTFQPTHMPTPFPVLPKPSLKPTHFPSSGPTIIKQSQSPMSKPTDIPTPAPSSLPTASDTVGIAASFKLTASAEPTDSDKTYLKLKVASSVGVNVNTIRRFTVVSSLARRLSRKLLRQQLRELLATYTWTVSFDVVVSLAATTSSSSSDLVSFVAAALTDASFVFNISTQLGATVDTDTVVAVRITRQPAAAPTTPPTAAPVAAGSIGGTSNGTVASTGDANSTGAKEAVSPIIGIVIGLLGGALIAVATVYVYRRRNMAKDKKKDKKDNGIETDFRAQVGALNVSIEDTDLVDGSVKQFLLLQANITSGKRLDQLVERFKEHGYESTDDFLGMAEEKLTDEILKDMFELNSPEIQRFKAALEAVQAVAFKTKGVPAAKVTAHGMIDLASDFLSMFGMLPYAANTEAPPAKAVSLAKLELLLSR